MPGMLTRLFNHAPQPAEIRAESNDAPVNPEVVRMLLAGDASASGVHVTPESSLRATAVFACVRVLSETLASLPLITYRRLPRGKDRAADFYLYSILHDTPNPEMTSFTFRETMTAHVALWGNGFAEIQPDGAGRARYLWPLLPNQTVPQRAENGMLFYKTYVPGAGYKGLAADRVLHVRGLGMNGLMGLSPIAQARNAVGLAMATEEFGARVFGNGSMPGVILKYPGNLDEPQYEAMQASWQAAHGGLTNAHRVAILEGGIEAEKIGMPNDDAQFLETRKFQVREIARLFRVPPHLISDLEQATFSNIEQQSLEFVIYTMLPWFARWEQEIDRSVLLDQERRTYFVEFLIDSLLRGDTATRFAAYTSAIQSGWMNRNEVREKENMNPGDPALDRFREPLNMQDVGGSSASATLSNIDARLATLEQMLAEVKMGGSDE